MLSLKLGHKGDATPCLLFKYISLAFCTTRTKHFNKGLTKARKEHDLKLEKLIFVSGLSMKGGRVN